MRDLSLAFFNVRSLTNNFSDFKTFIQQANYDIIGVSETWLSCSISNEMIHIEDYSFIRRDRTSRGGGVGIYLKSNIRYEILDINSQDALEHIWIKLVINKNTYIIGSLYRPPNKNMLDFINIFEDTVTALIPKCDNIICGGDININLLDLENDKTILFSESIDLFNFKQVISAPTRVTASSSTLIDVILILSEHNVQSCGTKSVDNISDHLLVFCSLKNCGIKQDSKIIKTRNFKRVDLDLLEELLRITPFHNILYLENVNEKIDYFNTLILNIFDTLAPVKNIVIRRYRPPWLTDNIQLLMKLRDSALAKFKKTKKDQDWNVYKSLRNQTNTAVFNEKKGYLLHCASNNSKFLWKKLKELNIYNKTSHTLPDNLNHPEDINKHFLSYSQNNMSADQELLQYYGQNLKTDFRSLFDFTPVSEDIVFKYLLEIKSKSAGADQINIDMLIFCCPFVLPFITNIVNSCLLDNIFPDIWKVSRVIPFPKIKNANLFSDLRPINILPVLSKLIEKIMNYQIRAHITEYNILPPYQSGFRPGHSCTTALINVTDDIIREIDVGKTTALILLDYSKAFDTINHELLLSILHFVGFSNNANNLIRSYLNNRVQFVETDKGQSCRSYIKCGVPQGSILGPLLFSIYTCNLTSCLQHCAVHLYADDTQIYYSFLSSDVKAANKIINDDLERLVNLSARHNLKINPTKSSVLMFGKNKDKTAVDINIAVGSDDIECVQVAKNLGLYIDNNLRFKTHVTKCIQNAYANLKLLYSNRNVLSESLKIKLTDTLVLSHFNYCDVIYGPCLDKLTSNRIERVQKSCLRFIYGIKKYSSVSHKLKTAKWLNMEDRRKLHCASIFHNIITNKSPPYLYNKIKYRSDVHTLNLRFRGQISPPPHRTTIFRRCYSYNLYSIYNKIPSTFKSYNLKKFKAAYKVFLLDK